MKKTILTLMLGLATVGMAAAQTTSTVWLQNDSSWTITQMYLSAVDVEEWGPDQLGEKTIAPGAAYTLHDVPCDVYDVRLVDEDGDVCIVGGAKLCGSDSAWTIGDEDLLDCQAKTEE